MLSSQDHHAIDRDWVGIGSGSWDYEGRASWVRLDRVLDVPEEGIRREGAILERETFEVVATRLARRLLLELARLPATSATWSGPPSGSVISPVTSKPNRW